MHYLMIYLAMLLGAFCTLVALTAMRRREKHNVGKFGWLVLILLTPPIGLILFIIFAGKKISAEHDQRNLVALPNPQSRNASDDNTLAEIAVTRGIPSPSSNNRMLVHTSPQSMLRALFELIDSAQHRLLIHTFILVDDAIGNEIVDRLCQKARRGVQVRLMVDGFGSFLFPDESLQRVTDAGGRASRFKPVSKLSRFAYSNFRNHRKMVIADGDRAFIGGANLVEYEITENPDNDTWIDYGLRIDGVAARQVEAVFLSDWKFATGEELATSQGEVNLGDCQPDDMATLQVVPVGPDGPTEIMDDLWLTAINRARERVWIVTPYFVPPPMAMRSLAMAVRRGVQVRIIYPNESDMAPADYARFEYARDLKDLGAKILRLPEKMVHAKMLLVDEEVAYCGSANFDMRSFFLNYELVVGIFNPSRIHEMADWFDELSSRCDEGPEADTWQRRSMSVLTRIFGEEL